MASNMKFALGDKLEDRITGFVGVVVGRADYITGCNTYLLVPKTDDPCKRPDGEWFDEQRLELLQSKSVVISEEDNVRAPGADIPAPKK